MRTDLVLIAVAVLGVGFDRVVSTPSIGPAARVLLAQNVGPLPTPAVNPGLGAAPPGGHLPGSVESAREAAPGGSARANTGGRLGTTTENHLGAPPLGAIPNAPTGAIPNAPTGAIPNAPTGAIPPPATGAVKAPPGSNLPAVGR